MRTLLVLIACSLVGGCASAPTQFTDGGMDIVAQAGQPYAWSFDEALSAASSDFIPVLGEWTREIDPASTSAPNVFRQRGEYGNPDFPRVVVRGLSFADLRVSVRCRPEAGDTDRACGLMFRVVDSDNYYVTRANAKEDNVRLYRVVNGDRQQFATANAMVSSGEWHTLEASARGDALSVRWDGIELISARDATFSRGKIGLWTKADSVTAFDDLTAFAD